MPSRAAQAFVRRAAGRVGLQAVRADYYSPLVDPRSLPPDTWERPAPMPGLELDLDGQLRMIEEWLMPLTADFRPPPENPWYRPMDAHVLYAMVRLSGPRRVLEVGSGYSTLIIQQALQAAARDEFVPRHDVIDPWPSPLIEPVAGRVTVQAQSAAVAPQELFDALATGDLLFVDSSHTVRPGGEVVRLVLEVLPSLKEGVVIHFHDFFRPFAYPRVLYEQLDVHWQEQYLLQALLADNPNFEVLCANHALWRLRRERVKQLFPSLTDEMEPSALWLRRL